MDYRTLFISNIASMTVFTVCMILLAWYNRSILACAGLPPA